MIALEIVCGVCGAVLVLMALVGALFFLPYYRVLRSLRFWRS